MMIKYSPQFARDVKVIADYIRDDLGNPMAAEKLRSAFFQEAKRLSDSPYLGEALPSGFRINNQNLRRLVFKNYLIIYRVTDLVVAERVLYARRDWMRILSENQNL